MYKLFHGTNVLQKQFNFVLVFNKFANGFAHINFNCKDGHKFAKKFANVQTSTNFLSVEDSSKLYGNIRKFVISLWMYRPFPPKQKNAVFFFQDACFSTNVPFFWSFFCLKSFLKPQVGRLSDCVKAFSNLFIVLMVICIQSWTIFEEMTSRRIMIQNCHF